jgi:hypothetical protein
MPADLASSEARKSYGRPANHSVGPAGAFCHSEGCLASDQFTTKIDFLRQNWPREAVDKKFRLLIWRRVEPLNRVSDLRITR